MVAVSLKIPAHVVCTGACCLVTAVASVEERTNDTNTMHKFLVSGAELLRNLSRASRRPEVLPITNPNHSNNAFVDIGVGLMYHDFDGQNGFMWAKTMDRPGEGGGTVSEHVPRQQKPGARRHHI